MTEVRRKKPLKTVHFYEFWGNYLNIQVFEYGFEYLKKKKKIDIQIPITPSGIVFDYRSLSLKY
jgi:hypothetical protein